MRKLIILSLVFGSFAGIANAMPIGDLRPAGISEAAPKATNIDYACGRGWRMNRWGECVRVQWRRPPPPGWGWGPPPPRRDWGPPPWARGHYQRPRHWGYR